MGFGGALHGRERAHVLGELFDLVDQAPGLVGLDESGHARLLQRGAQLVDVLRAGQEREFPVEPGVDDLGRVAGRSDHGGDEDVRIEHHAHQDFSACSLVRRSARTSLTASSTMR